MREIRTLRAMRRELETEPRRVRFGHEGRYPGHSQGVPCGPPRQFPTLPGRCPRGPVTRVAGILSRRRTRQNAARAPRKLPLVEGVGTGCQPVPWAYSLSRVLREVRVPAGSLDLPGPGLTRGAAEESQTVSVLNELRRSRGKGSPETSLVHGRHRLAAWTCRARNLREVQQKSRREFLFSMNCGAAAARALQHRAG